LNAQADRCFPRSGDVALHVCPSNLIINYAAGTSSETVTRYGAQGRVVFQATSRIRRRG